MESPFFIVGSARSGTTLLRLMLNAHAEIAVPPESRFIVELWPGSDAEVGVDSILRALSSHNRFQAWDLPIEAVREEMGPASTAAYRDILEAVYGAYTRINGKKRWGDKTPRYVENIPLLAGLWPESRFIHLVRDGRNVALSYANVPFGPRTVSKAAALWAKRVAKGLADGRSLPPGRYIEIRYEDLVEDAEGETKDLCDFLQVDFDPGMLDYTERARDAVLTRAARFNPHVVEKPIQGTSHWGADLPARLVEVFEVVGGDVLSELGYERRFPEPGRRARMHAALGKLGLPIGRLPSTSSGRSLPDLDDE